MALCGAVSFAVLRQPIPSLTAAHVVCILECVTNSAFHYTSSHTIFSAPMCMHKCIRNTLATAAAHKIATVLAFLVRWSVGAASFFLFLFVCVSYTILHKPTDEHQPKSHRVQYTNHIQAYVNFQALSSGTTTAPCFCG